MLFKKKIDTIVIKPLNKIKPIDGLMITDGENYWFIKGGKRMKCFSRRSFESWGLEPILLTPSAINAIKPGGILGFRDGSLIKDIVSGKIYLVSSSKVRLITEPTILDILGRDRIIEVSPEEIDIHTKGEVLDASITS
jgi:hypothetical protein